ncbi:MULTISPECIES: glutamate-5-semialdehyde dehydrogenase [unclassified Breznakia]|uniref:glutamate-5-semialdehyde dehydrogenase n=1 Tax=unclassified Breznakia TaxID=2623764 RepID=UPI002475B928|nr:MULTISPECIES: glutamate-5-semialdehyde dehydrogenase [unclassified Breznakia]MDH6367797.1 glutamate-5-semialdehyde dehydrogenase [Breznakia sp. PH1-1]MDH6404906.1 glutamate-5-semialdehyde dehydrogenase [Breznakia sp. PF1-11]MDH6412600.1 glutamate-5-semialdehyde dehydrogenase [Breznakia sp. PFB1-11]MDH6414981.1 glutamate-5-semialdehyde dehydrogenase [Breznakia sp. PFB1-14]MDH6417292.1 glutamate-5-semialdehyde dehydrogenase [Breznakia sp. PFB1-4]
MNELQTKGKLCKEASWELMNLSTDTKNEILAAIATSLMKHVDDILAANAKDVENAKANGRPESFIDRLTLDEARLSAIVNGVNQVISLEDPSNKIIETWPREELFISKKSVPIGVIGMIYEARPNVSVDSASLCLKSGNVCFLRGSKDTIYSNIALVKAMKEGITNAGYNEHFIELLEDTSRESATAFMKLNEYLDLLIPRGGANLIQSTIANATVPIIETGTGNCHVYVDKEFDATKALAIIENAKTQRVSVCNACESVLLHKDIVNPFAHNLIKMLKRHHVIIHGDEIIQGFDDSVLAANEEDYGKEYLDYEISIKVVDDVNEAIRHINHYSTHHSDVIVTENSDNMEAFLNQVDSAVVYANASSRFSDGEEFGFGAEIGISTQKIHARGPMGLEALTSYKYIVKGNGTIRK